MIGARSHQNREVRTGGVDPRTAPTHEGPRPGHSPTGSRHGASLPCVHACAVINGGYGVVAWDLDPEHWLEAACHLTFRNLTHAEWDRYIGDLAEHRDTCPHHPTGDARP